MGASSHGLIGLMVGPATMAVAIHIRGDFRFYAGGVNAGVCGDDVHFATIVGYGTTDMDYVFFWNSWGANWGEDGYMRYIRGMDQRSLLPCCLKSKCYIIGNKFMSLIFFNTSPAPYFLD